MLALRRTLTATIQKGKALTGIKNKHTLPQLPYEYNALEPIICCEIMQLHHTKHHAAYVNGLNDAEDKIQAALSKCDFAAVIALGDAIRFNGGGHINHSLFWENMSPCGGEPSHELKCAIDQDFGCLDRMKDLMSQLAVGVQGSGWAWLGYNPAAKRLQLSKCANQDPLEPTTGLIPLLGIDVWEHAYYIQYKNVRAEYVKNFWDIVNWKVVSERFACASKS